ncbi:MAG TPA: hypothetical protein VGM63_21970 [Mucilaginibacter sp.]
METSYLKTIAKEIAEKNNQEEYDTPDKHLASQAAIVQKIITNQLLSLDSFTLRESFYYNTLTRLVEICDILFDISNKITPDVTVLLDLLTEVKKVIPSEISPKLQLPKAFVFLQKQPMLESCQIHRDILKQQEVDFKLITIAGIPFQQFTKRKHKLYWRNYTWLKGYEEKLETVDWENADCNSKTEALISLLINCDFNDDRFFIYCKKYILARVTKYGTKKKRLAEYAECAKLILEDTHHEFARYNHRRKMISEKLIDWISKEVEALKANDSYDDEIYKIVYNWDVDTLALYYKFLMDHGITKKVNTELYAKQIAATCSSITKEEFQWETIHKRLYSKEQRSLKRIFDPLLAIIESIKRFLKR